MSVGAVRPVYETMKRPTLSCMSCATLGTKNGVSQSAPCAMVLRPS